MTHCHMCWPVGGCAPMLQSRQESQSHTLSCSVGTIWNRNPPIPCGMQWCPCSATMQTALPSGPDLCSTWSWLHWMRSNVMRPSGRPVRSSVAAAATSPACLYASSDSSRLVSDSCSGKRL